METIKFKEQDIELDVNFSSEENTVWLTLDEMATLFSNARSTISYHVKNIYQSIDELNSHTSVEKFDGSQRNRLARKYDLDVITLVGQRTKSKIINTFYKWCIDNLNELRSKSISQSNIIRFSEGKVSLDVNISSKEDTIWLTVNQISQLFDTSTDNVYLHIKNIYEEGELNSSVTEDSSVTQTFQKEYLFTASDGKNYLTTFYNLDMILAIGYRVKSKIAIAFRRWATNVLKEYLLKGYVINEQRTLVTNENYINLINRVDKLDQRISVMEDDYISQKEKIFFNGKLFDVRTLIKKLIERAKDKIILIDPYADTAALDYLKVKDNKVKIELYISSYAKLTQNDIDSFNKQYNDLSVYINDTFHDRFLIIDDIKVYLIGSSLNYLGQKTIAIIEINKATIKELKSKL